MHSKSYGSRNTQNNYFETEEVAISGRSDWDKKAKTLKWLVKWRIMMSGYSFAGIFNFKNRANG